MWHRGDITTVQNVHAWVLQGGGRDGEWLEFWEGVDVIEEGRQGVGKGVGFLLGERLGGCGLFGS